MKIKDMSTEIEDIYNSFEKLEKNLDFLESLENKKFSENEKMKMLQKIVDLEKHITNIESSLKDHREMIAKGHKKNLSMKSAKSKNDSDTVLIKNPNRTLHNINEYGYEDDDISEFNNSFK